LLILDVGEGGVRKGQISGLALPWLIYGHHSVEVGYRYANTGKDERTALAFGPVLDAAMGGTHRQVKGPLVFPGASRSGAVVFDLGNRLGPVRVAVRDTTGGGSQAVRWVWLVTGFWVWLLPVLTAGLLAVVAVWWWGGLRLSRGFWRNKKR
jgi:hypothetical protein